MTRRFTLTILAVSVLTVLGMFFCRVAAAQAIEVELTNNGPDQITFAEFGFDVPPLNPYEINFDVTDFSIGGTPISSANPLLPGHTIVSGPHTEFVPGTVLDFYGFNISDTVDTTHSGFQTLVVPNVTVGTFDFAPSGITLSGIYRILAVPEPDNKALFLGLGTMGTGFLLCRRKRGHQV